MDAFELLKADHRKVAKLFDQMEAASGQAKLDVFNQIKNELELHTHVEETIFYPALEGPEETHDLTLEAYEEHKMVKTLLAELDGAKAADDEWQVKAKVLRENVEHHVDEEEGELFDKAGDALSDEEIEALGTRMEAEKAAQPGQPAARKAPARVDRNVQAKAAKPGVLSRLATLVGLQDGGAKRRSSKKTAAKKKAPAKKRTNSKSATASKAGKRSAATRASKKRGQKSRGTTTGKRASAAQGMKRMPARSSSSRSRPRTAARSAKKTSKKTTRRG